ncbi:MAG: small basic family protein [Bacillota bacterium]|nr:small basic family protein [Bacillota bacterium]
MLPLLGIIIGLLIGLFMNVEIPRGYSAYVAIFIVAAFDSLVGAIRANLEERFSLRLLLTGLLGNSLIALFLTALGERLKLELNLAAVFAFVIRIINNFSIIRRLWLEQLDRRVLQRRRVAGQPTVSNEERVAPHEPSSLGRRLPGAREKQEGAARREPSGPESRSEELPADTQG